MISWPGIIKHSGDAELVYISDQAEWDSDAGLHNFKYDPSDYPIDTSGSSFTLTQRENDSVIPHNNGSSLTLYEIINLIKAHAAQNGSGCVAKLYTPTISEAFKIMESLDEA